MMHNTLLCALYGNPVCSWGAQWALDAEAGWYALCSVQCKALQAVSVQASPFWAQWARAAGRTCLHCHLTHRSDHSQLTRHKI